MRGLHKSGRGGVGCGDRAQCLGAVEVCGRLSGGRLHSEAQGHCPVQEQLFVNSGPALRGSGSDLTNRWAGGALQ